MDNLSPSPNRQKAVTPKFLRYLHQMGSDVSSPCAIAHSVDLLIGGFFFAVRPCEIVLTKTPGKTKTLCLGDVVFRASNRRVIPRSHPNLPSLVHFISLTWRDQKNGLRMDTRTQRIANDPVLCPSRLAKAVQRILSFVPEANEDTLLCTHRLPHTAKPSFVTDDFTLKLLRNTCTTFGGKDTFGFTASEIGNRSIRSGAAMALFLKDHSVHKIMILGRWSSDAFLVCIRPQVLEWTNNMSRDMVSFDSFLDIGLWDIASTANPKQRRRTNQMNGRNTCLQMPAFNIHG